MLLPVLYRVWAKARANFLENLIRVAGAQPVEEDHAACEDLALDLAFTMEAAQATGREAWAVATDLSKAYDRMPLEVLEGVLREGGLPAGLWRPIETNLGDWDRRVWFNRNEGPRSGGLGGALLGGGGARRD